MKADRRKVRAAMERAGMTVADVAQAAKLSPQTAAAIICGMDVQPDTLARIAQALDVGVYEIAKGWASVPQRAGGDCPQAGETPDLPAGQVLVNLERFKEAMARSGLDVKAISRRAGVSVDVIRSILRGAEAHRVDTVDKLADALGVAAYYITKKEDNR